MKPKRLEILAAVVLQLMLNGCATPTEPASEERPRAFHDTRLQFALVTGDDRTLAKDYAMTLPPSWAERIVAGGVLPFTAATETVFWPFFAAINKWAPEPRSGPSTQ